MREKLRNYHDGEILKGQEAKDKIQKLVARFKSESRDLLSEGDSDLPRPMSYYTAVFAGAFEFLRQNPSEIKTLQEAFVTFSERLLKFMNEKKGTGENLESFFDSDILDKQDEIQYGAEFSAETVKDEKVEQKVSKKPQNPESSIVKVDPRLPKVIIIIPFAMVCSGKSHVWGFM